MQSETSGIVTNRVRSIQDHFCAVAPSFETHWHPQLGARLTVFPRRVELILPKGHRRTKFWPDFATLVEDESHRIMMYYPAEHSGSSLQVAFAKAASTLHLSAYLGADLVGHIVGPALTVEPPTARGEQ